MSVLSNFDQWKEFLGDRVQQAVDTGMAHEKVDQVAFRVGEYLAEKVDPKNEQERLLAEMWRVSGDEDRHALARMMVNLVTHH
ncbi:DUF3243 domain-containing protein [Tumebacillus flagellatus]|uniref:DUF3243 domain-containing protein n=1 Tax=Tumebacillus flagellatus TaxID=1157490 RepID=A0A074LIR0_9BACL|nr:DUF3243 domain-containing protein [Tumebacillus flagellatus]KEO82081.1 hypothetical protein EL26_17380 [Tumebacillus flagellatus]